jgi:Carboxypeptidase regulatory-like domain
MQNRNSRVAATLLLVLAIIFSPSALRADVTGSILGVVHDRSQAVVAGARIVATNVQTNFKQETVSAADGSYRILALPPGNYKLTATAPGFQQFVTTDIDLKVNDQLRIDVTLEVGSMQQQVSVAANAVQVETESTQLGDVIESKKMLALPLNGRSYLDLLGLQPGVVPVTSGTMQQDRPVSGGYSTNVGNLSVNGQRETANAFLVNGGDVSEGRNLGAGLVPNLDSVEEFRLITNSFDAEYGKFSGAVMNTITKSGTNGIHGDVFEYLRNDKFDARSFFDPTKAELRRHQFGYAIGGPFWKNKLFWFTDYQGTRQIKGASTGLVQLPTTAQRGGTFDPSAFLDANGHATKVQGAFWAQTLTNRLTTTTGQTVTDGEFYGAVEVPTPTPTDPNAFRIDPCTNTTQCVFPGGVIPSSAFAGPAVKILPYIPQGDPITGLFADSSQRNKIQDDKVGQRVDFNNKMTGDWSFYYHFDDSNAFNALDASVPGFSSVTSSRAQQFVVSNNKTFGSSAVNQFRLSFFRTATHTDEPQSSFAKLSDLGFVTGPGTLGIIPSGPAGFPQTVPPIYLNNFSLGVNTLTTFQPNNTWHASDTYSKTRGVHTFKFGGEFRYLQINERNTCAPNGDFTFDGSITGSDFADYLLGAAQNYNQCSQQFLDSRSRYGGAFAEDTYKVRPNLTLNLGVRWEVSMPWYDTQGKIETIVPGLQSTQFPTAPLGWVVPGDPGIPSTLAPTRYNDFSPRLGIAYSPGFKDGVGAKIFGGPGKTSIRASYGIYYTSIEDLNLFYEVGDAPFGLYWVSPNPVNFDQPFQELANGMSETQRFPFVLPTPGSPANKTLDYSIYLPISFSPGYDIHNRPPYAEHYNLSIQRELSKSTVLTLAYVGTQGHKLIAQYDANPGDAALCLQLNQIGATPTCGVNGENQTYALPPTTPAPAAAFTIACPTTTPPTPPGSTCIAGTRDKLGPAFSQNNSFTANLANSSYSAAQITVERKAADFTFLAAYTFSKAMDNSSGFGQWVNFADPRLSRSLSAYDITHNFVVSYIWAVPFDRAFGKLPKRLTQGWALNGITHFSGGLPVSLSQGGDNSFAGSSNTDVPNIVGKVVIQDPRKPDPNCPPSDTSGCPNTYFLRGAFTSGPPGQFGNANRQFFHGPGISNTDFGLSKRTLMKEALGFEIRAEFFNIFNHAQFNNPNGNFNDDTFGRVNSTRADGRTGQVSAKFFW